MVADMNTKTATEIRDVAYVLNRAKLDELRRANGIRTEAELARIIGVNTATLHRVTKCEVKPSNGFMARVKLAFPHVPMEALFSIERAA